MMAYVDHKIVEYHNINMSKGVFLTSSDYPSFVMNWRFVRDSERRRLRPDFSKRSNRNISKSTGENKKSLVDVDDSSTGGIREPQQG